MFYDGGLFMGGMHWLGWIFWLGLIVVLVLVVLRRGGEPRQPVRETPHEILRRRLANGEIGADQYEQSKALLDRDTAGKT